MPQRILALEIDAHEMKAAVLETSFRDYKVVGFYREAMAANGTPAEQVRRFVETNHFDANTVLSSLPGDLVTLRTFYLPFRDRKRLDQTVPFELENLVAFGLDDVVIAYQVLQRDKVGSTVLAALVQRQDLEAHLATLSDAGLDPKVVDFAPLATLNILNLLGSDLPDTFAYVGGSLRHTVVALYRNRQLVGLRPLTPYLAATAEAEAEAAASSNGHPSGEKQAVAELVRDIRWTLLALNGAPLDEGLPCLVAGEGISFDDVAQQLGASMGLSVQRIDQTPLRALPADLRAQMGPFVASLGLALREVAPNEAVGLNFRQGEFAYHRGQQEVRRAMWSTGAIAALAAVLFIANTYMQYQQLERRLDALNKQVRSVFTQTLPDIHNVRDEKRQLQDEVDAAEKRLKLISGVVPPSGTTAIDALQRLSTSVPGELKVDIDEYVMDTEDIKIKAKTDSLDTPNAVREAIAATRYFSDVQVKNIKTGNDGRVDFQLVLSLSKDGMAPAGRQ